MSEQLTDQVLVERVQKGDQKAFNLLVVRYQHKVASLVSRYVPSGDVPDVVQESFIKAYRALDSFREIVLFIPGYTVSPSIRQRIIWLLRDVVRLPVMLTQSTPKTSKVAAH
jgi:DNA-directed RNA polymerase specialized sigma subunit